MAAADVLVAPNLPVGVIAQPSTSPQVIEIDITECPIRSLPEEILLLCSMFLPLHDVLSFGAVCRDFRFIRRENLIWRHFYEKRWISHPAERRALYQGLNFSWADEFFWRSRIRTSIVHSFNKAPSASDALDYLVTTGLLPSPDAAFRFVSCEPGLSQKKRSALLFKMMDAGTLSRFMDSMDFRGLAFIDAFRQLLQTVRMVGESQRVHGILEAFTESYVGQNPNVAEQQLSADSFYRLAHALLVINADAHSPSVKHKLPVENFIADMAQICAQFPAEYIRNLYNAVHAEPLQSGELDPAIMTANVQILPANPNPGAANREQWIAGKLVLSSCLTFMEPIKKSWFERLTGGAAANDENAGRLRGRLQCQPMRAFTLHQYKRDHPYCLALHAASGMTLVDDNRHEPVFATGNENEGVLLSFATFREAEKWRNAINEVINTEFAVDLWSDAAGA